MKYLLFFLLMFVFSCRFVENSLNKLKGEEYTVPLKHEEIEHYDSIVRLILYYPDSYNDSISNYNDINQFDVEIGPIDTLKKYNNNKIVLCLKELNQGKIRNKITMPVYGYLVYKIDNTDMKLRVFVMKQKYSNPSIGFYIKKEKSCKHWKWNYYPY